MTDNPELDAYVEEELPKIIKLIQNSRLHELKLESQDAQLVIRRTVTGDGEGAVQAVVETATVADSGPQLKMVTSPTVGVFFHAEQPGRAPLVKEGSRVERGTLIGVIEALQVITEVESDATGVVQRVVAGDGVPVEYGQPLVELLTEA